MMFEADKVKISLPKIEVGLIKYQKIMSMVHKVDVSSDLNFQKMYNGFYRVRQRKPEFYSSYYGYMERMKQSKISFEEVLRYLYDDLGRVEPSFSSKLVATLDDSKPVWDTHVLNNLGLKQPYYTSKNDVAKQRRIKKLTDLYSRIEEWYLDALDDATAHEAIRLFDEYYPDTEISKTKKIDLILWQSR